MEEEASTKPSLRARALRETGGVACACEEEEAPELSPEQFRARLKALGLSLGRFSRLAGVAISTASYWGKERPGAGFQAFPLWVGLLLIAWEKSPELLMSLNESA